MPTVKTPFIADGFSGRARPTHRPGGPKWRRKIHLLKILAGVLTPQKGQRTLGHNVKTGYYSQYRVDMLIPDRSVLEEGLDTPQRVTEQFVRTLLGSFLFRGDDVFKR